MSDAKPKLLQIIDHDGHVVGVANVGEAATQAIEDLPKGYVLTPTVAADDGLYGFRLDAVPAQPTERTERMEAIVRALAACEPECNGDGFNWCVYCNALTHNINDTTPTQDHEGSCLWRLARELIGDSE